MAGIGMINFTSPVPPALRERVSKYNWFERTHGGRWSSPPNVQLTESTVKSALVIEFEEQDCKMAFLQGDWHIEFVYGGRWSGVRVRPGFRGQRVSSVRHDGVIWVVDRDWLHGGFTIPDELYELSESRDDKRKWGDLFLALVRPREHARDDWLAAGLIPDEPDLKWLADSPRKQVDPETALNLLIPPMWR